MTVGLLFVPAGRSAIIAYLSPFFVTPIAMAFFGEKLSFVKLIGLFWGILGVALLFAPWELDWHDMNLVLGNGILVLSSVSWSIAMLFTRYSKWHTPVHLLLPWQLALASIVTLAAALLIERVPHVILSYPLILSLLYNIVLSTVIGSLLLLIVTRSLPVISTSLFLLGVPVLGIISSGWLLEEHLSNNAIIAVSFIIIGLLILTIGERISRSN